MRCKKGTSQTFFFFILEIYSLYKKDPEKINAMGYAKFLGVLRASTYFGKVCEMSIGIL